MIKIFQKKTENYKALVTKILKDIDVYVKFSDDIVPIAEERVSDSKIEILQYWNTGRHNAPIIVNRCFESVERHILYKKFFVNHQNDSTIQSYIQIPKEVVNIKSKINIANYSDLIRLLFLIQKGGLWLDSTIYLTGFEDVEYLTSSKIGLFNFPKNNSAERGTNEIGFSSWFLFSRPELSDFWVKVYESFFELLYNPQTNSYFNFHYALDYVFVNNQHLFSYTKLKSSVIAHELQQKLLFDYNELEWKNLTRQCDIHKITYKVKSQSYNDFLNYLLDINDK